MDLKTLLKADREEIISKLQKAISYRSVREEDGSGYPYGQGVQDCLEYMLSLGRELGFRTVNMDNQVGWCEFGEGEEMVAILGHLDVVPEGDGWTVPPYDSVVKDGRIYGRGSSDNKGPVIASMYALKALRESGVPLRRRIRILMGTNEETGSADMKYYLAHGGEIPVMGFTPDADYPVINGEKGLVTSTFQKTWEQSGEIRLVRLTAGEAPNIVPAHAWTELQCPPSVAERICDCTTEKVRYLPVDGGVRIEAEGASCHAASPWKGENAAGRLLLALNQLPLEGELKDTVSFLAEKIGMEHDGTSLGIRLHDDASGPLTLNMGVVSADESGIFVRLNYRYPVTYTADDCIPILEKQFSDAGFERTAHLHKNALYMAPDSPLVEKLTEVYVRCTGLDGTPVCIGGGTYAKSIPNTLAFGAAFPGEVNRVHEADESVSIENLMRNAEIIAEAMYALAN